MVNLIYCEVLKLKRSKMFLISLFGALAAPLMCFIGCLKLKVDQPEYTIPLSKMFSETNLYMMLLVGTTLYGIIAAHLISREYTEKTLKNILTIPISKTSFLFGKYITLMCWILILSFLSWVLTLGLGLLGQFEGVNGIVLIQSFLQFMLGGCLLFLLTTPFVGVTLWFKNLLPTVILATVITMVNIAVSNDALRAVFPWTAVIVVTNGEVVPQYPVLYSVTVILAVSFMGFMGSLWYFRHNDIQ